MVKVGDSVRSVFRGTSSLRSALRKRDALTLRDQVAITRIASPTGEEEERGRLIHSRFKAHGLADVRVDRVGNVIGRRPGTADLPPVVVCAHMDTVFSRDTELSVRAEDQRLCAPGIGDNSRGLAAMLALTDAFNSEGVATEAPIDFVASTGEEGSGDLRGTKYFFAEHGDVTAAIALDGPGDSRIVNSALGCFRLRLIFSGPGGHSWSAFGAPNAAHAVGMATSAIARIPVPSSPRATISVTRIGGGVAINCIPDHAWLEVDMRSTSERTLRELADAVLTAAYSAERNVNDLRDRNTEPLQLDIEIVGRRPSGFIDADHPLAVAAAVATELVGRVPELSVASTDANVPLSLGIPAIAIGAGGRGGGAHTKDEWYENADGALGIVRASTIVLSAAGLA